MGSDNPWLSRRLLQVLLGTIIILVGLGCYLAILRWRGPAALAYTQTAWDRAIPFHAGWLYVYLAPYAIAPILLAIMQSATFTWFLKRALLLLAISLVIFCIYPTQTIRPPTGALDSGWTAKFYREMVAIDDPPANAAPSLHVSLTCLLAIALLTDFPRWWPLIVGGIALVWLATLLTWQHHLIDVATGALLGLAMCIPFGNSKSHIGEQRGSSPPTIPPG
jgi:hypothetical protein